jgi:hypothetical protein
MTDLERALAVALEDSERRGYATVVVARDDLAAVLARSERIEAAARAVDDWFATAPFAGDMPLPMLAARANALADALREALRP